MHLGQKQSEYPNFNIVGEIWMQNQAQMAYWQKTVKLVLYKTIILTCRVLWTLRYSILLAPFSVKMMDPGTRMKVYDNFANDFYININNIMVLPKIAVQIHQ
jgi:hypothetical protein